MLASLPRLTGFPGLGVVEVLAPDRLMILRRIARECGTIGAFHAGPHQVVVTSDATLVRRVLQDMHHYPQPEAIYQLGQTVIGEALLTVRPEHHTAARAQLRPLFAPQVLATLLPAVQHVVDTQIASCPATRPVELVAFARQLITSATCQLVLGSAPPNTFRLDAALHALFEGILWQVVLPLPWHWPAPAHAVVLQNTHRIQAYVEACLKAQPMRECSVPSMAAWLQAAWAEQPPHTIRDTTVMLLLTALENTAHSLFWILALLGRDQPLQSQIRDELREQGQSATLTLVQRETLRLYPGGYAMLRWSPTAQQLGDYLIPSGSFVIADIYHLQRSPAHYTRPDHFEPQRFAATGAALATPAYLPFGVGPRVCIGKALATSMIETVVTSLLQQRFINAISPLPAHSGSVTLQPAGPMHALVGYA